LNIIYVLKEIKEIKTMENNKTIDRKDCATECEKRFIEQTARTYTGGVEELRSCREKCPEKAAQHS